MAFDHCRRPTVFEVQGRHLVRIGVASAPVKPRSHLVAVQDINKPFAPGSNPVPVFQNASKMRENNERQLMGTVYRTPLIM